MSRPANRTQLMDRVGAVQLNTVWSWCAVNEEKRQVYFSIWTDKLVKDAEPRTYVIQEPHWGVSEQGATSAARNDHDAKLALVLERGYEPYGYFIEARDPTAIPREIENTATSFVVRLEVLKRSDGVVTGRILERREIR
jgi:hypothetical protein